MKWLSGRIHCRSGLAAYAFTTSERDRQCIGDAIQSVMGVVNRSMISTPGKRRSVHQGEWLRLEGRQSKVCRLT